MYEIVLADRIYFIDCVFFLSFALGFRQLSAASDNSLLFIWVKKLLFAVRIQLIFITATMPALAQLGAVYTVNKVFCTARI